MSREAPAPGQQLSLRHLAVPIYLPNFLLALGQGAILPILALAARDDGASAAVASIVVSMNALGTMAFDLPSGWIVARLGEARSTWIAGLFICTGVLGALVTHSALMLGASVFVVAAGWAVWQLIRLSHISRTVPVEVRGRALSIFGGVGRAGNVLAPFLVLAVFNQKPVRGSFLVYFITVVVGFSILGIFRDRSDHGARQRQVTQANPFRIISQHRSEFATAGVGTFGISLLRGSRQVIIPLWAAHVGLSARSVDLIFGIASLVDLSLFYPAGVISDRFGRRAVAVPCLALLSVGHILMPLSHAYDTVLFCSIFISIGNGLGSGIIMTIGADRAPDVGRASFLAVWRLCSDAGTSSGPLLDAGLIGAASISLACPVIGVVGLAITVVIAGWMHEVGDILTTSSREPPPLASSTPP